MIECKNIVKKYQTITAVDDISLELKDGKIYALLGPNGSGKSTLMKMIAGLIKPTSGEIFNNHVSLSIADKAKIAYMPTEDYFFSYMNCTDVANYYKDFFKDFNYDKFFELLEEFDLRKDQKVKEMSSGMMAKLKIIVNLSRECDLILLDEPLNGIDIIAREKVSKAIQNNIKSGTSVVISSHLVEELEQMVDEVIFIKKGKCILRGDLETVKTEQGKSITDVYKEIYA